MIIIMITNIYAFLFLYGLDDYFIIFMQLFNINFLTDLTKSAFGCIIFLLPYEWLSIIKISSQL